MVRIYIYICVNSHLRHHRIERELRLELLPRRLGDGRERRGWHGHFLKQRREIDERDGGVGIGSRKGRKKSGSGHRVIFSLPSPPLSPTASKKVTLFPFIGGRGRERPPLVQPLARRRIERCAHSPLLRKTQRRIWTTITSMERSTPPPR